MPARLTSRAAPDEDYYFVEASPLLFGARHKCSLPLPFAF